MAHRQGLVAGAALFALGASAAASDELRDLAAYRLVTDAHAEVSAALEPGAGATEQARRLDRAIRYLHTVRDDLGDTPLGRRLVSTGEVAGLVLSALEDRRTEAQGSLCLRSQSGPECLEPLAALARAQRIEIARLLGATGEERSESTVHQEARAADRARRDAEAQAAALELQVAALNREVESLRKSASAVAEAEIGRISRQLNEALSRLARTDRLALERGEQADAATARANELAAALAAAQAELDQAARGGSGSAALEAARAAFRDALAAEGLAGPGARLLGDRLILRSDGLFTRALVELSDSGKRSVAALAAALAEALPRGGPDTVVMIEGHTDPRPISTPRFPSNWELSYGRAAAVAQRLAELGIPTEALAPSGHGASRPFSAGRDEEAYRDTRRLEVWLGLRPGAEEHR